MSYSLEDWFNYFFVKAKPNKRLSIFNVARFKKLHATSAVPDEALLSFLGRKGVAVQMEPVYDIEVFEKSGSFEHNVLVRMTAPFEGVLYTNEYWLADSWQTRARQLGIKSPADDQIVDSLAKHLRRYLKFMFGDNEFGIVRFHHFRDKGDDSHFLDNPLFVTWFASIGIIALRGKSGNKPSSEFRDWEKVYKGAFWSGFVESQFYQSLGRKVEKAPLPHNVTKEFTLKMAHVNWALLTAGDMELVSKIHRGGASDVLGIFTGWSVDSTVPEGIDGFMMNLGKYRPAELTGSLCLQGFSDRFVSFVHRLKLSNFAFVRFTPDGCEPKGWATVDDDARSA